MFDDEFKAQNQFKLIFTFLALTTNIINHNTLAFEMETSISVSLCVRHFMLKYVLYIDVSKPGLYNSFKLKWPYHFNGFKINAYTYENFHV